MKKQSPVGLFFSILLRAVVIIFGIAIIAFGIFFLTRVVRDSKNAEQGPVTTLPSDVLTDVEGHDDLMTNPTETTEATTEAPPMVYSYDKNILILNSTNTTGLAGRWREKLQGMGYTNVEVGDYSNTQTNTRVVSTEDGIGEDLLQYFNAPTYEIGVVSEGTSASVEGKDIVIIIGTNDDDGQ